MSPEHRMNHPHERGVEGEGVLTNCQSRYGLRACGVCKVYHLEHEGQKDVVLALALLEGGEVCGEQGVRVHPRHLHVPLVQGVVHQLDLEFCCQ